MRKVLEWDILSSQKSNAADAAGLVSRAGNLNGCRGLIKMNSEKVWKIPKVSRVLAVGSCKGGVGKTTVSVNLALALGRFKARVGLFDADLYGPNVPAMLGARNERTRFPMVGMRKGKPAYRFIPVARADSTPYIRPFEKYGLKVMSLGFWFGDNYTVTEGSLFGGQMLRQTLQDVIWGELDYLIIDLPPGTGGPEKTILNTVQIDGVLIVTTPQDLSLIDTGRSMRVFRKSGVSLLGVVENMSYLICPFCKETVQVFEKSGDDWPIYKELPLMGKIPLDRAINRTIDESHPLLQEEPDSHQASVFMNIASKVVKKLSEV